MAARCAPGHACPIVHRAQPTRLALIAATCLALPLSSVACGSPAAPRALGSEAPRPSTEQRTEPEAGGDDVTLAPADPPEPARRRYAVAAVGDSLTAARSHGGGYLAYLRERCPESRFEDFGRGGDMVNMMRRRFERDVLPITTELTHVLVFGGVNDLYSDLTAGRTPTNISEDLSAMYAAARERGLGVVALTVAPWGGSRRYNDSRGAATRELNEWIRGTASGRATDHVIDAYTLLSCGDPERLCPAYQRPWRDGLHFGPGGHEVLGEALYREVFADCR